MKKFISTFTAICISASLFAMDFTFRVAPGLLLPSDSNYETGFGGFFQIDADFLAMFTAGVEGQFAMVKPSGLEENVSITGAGAGLGAYYYPFSRLYLGAGGAAGIYQWSTKIDGKEQTASDIYYRGYGEIGFRVTPEFTIAATGGIISYQVSDKDPLLEGTTAGLSLRYTVPFGKSGSSAFGIGVEQDDSAFPLFMSAYRTCPLGTLTLTNNEGAEVRDVHVSFRAGKYTSSTFESAKIGRINKHSSVEIPLYADFSAEILRFSENGKISGELVVDYEFLGKRKQSVQNCVLSVYNRNAFSWSDYNALAAFVSSNTDEVLKLAKYISGIVNNMAYSGMNKGVQTAAAMMEGLRLAGIKNSDDKVTPYIEYHLSEKLDSIQYPLQTMNTLSGDLDDMGILLASCLESVGVGTGFLPLDDDFIVLVNLGINPKNAASHFSEVKNLVIDDDNAWFGLSMKNFDKGFTASRKAAAKAIRAANEDTEGSYEYVNNEVAWETYAPAVFTGSGNAFENPSQTALEKAAKSAIQEYISSDLEIVISKARASGDQNKLGMALVRAGRYADARAAFSQATTVSSMNNLANVYMLERNYSAAAAQYKKVLAKAPDNKGAARGLDKANFNLGL